ncbi:MAG: DNA cytosine methyltransferase [Bacteroidales bacterium]|nr:DNA cytosine methyltransferase [Bacteroidales bacterium]
MTPRECALIQTCPPDYEFVRRDKAKKRKSAVSTSGAYKVIGNAVPPLLAYNIAIRLQELWPKFFGDE